MVTPLRWFPRWSPLHVTGTSPVMRQVLVEFCLSYDGPENIHGYSYLVLSITW